jgi:hypothetical protein
LVMKPNALLKLAEICMFFQSMRNTSTFTTTLRSNHAVFRPAS